MVIGLSGVQLGLYSYELHITKSDDRAAEVRFVYEEYHYGPKWTTLSLITN